MPVFLLTTKLYLPRPRPGLVSRPRLLQRLDEGLADDCRVFLVAAPAGFGKTTLVSEWLDDRRLATRGSVQPSSDVGRPSKVAWLSLDPDDNDPARFLAYLIAALEAVQAGISPDLLALLQSPQPPPCRAVLTALINRLSEASQPAILVLDDYHQIEAAEIHGLVAFLIDHLPARLHLVLAGRTAPPLPLARLRARRQLVELGAADLRFTLDETAAFLSQEIGQGLTLEDIAALEARTEGWIAGLQLAAAALQAAQARQVQTSENRRSDISSFVAAFTGNDRYVLDYLVEEVLRLQPQGIQDFLLRTAILDRLCGPLCDQVAGEVGERTGENASPSQEILEYLERSNLFILPLDNERRWYRYHNLFAEFLRSRQVQPSQDGLIVECHRRAAYWYEANGFPAEAIKHVLAAQEYVWAARLIETTTRPMWMVGEARRVLAWLQAIPEPVMQARPHLGLAYAWTLLAVGQVDAVAPRLQAVVQAAGDDDQIRGEAAALRALVANLLGDAPRAIDLAQRALEILPEGEAFLRGLVALNLGLAYDTLGDMPSALAVYHEAVRLGRASGAILVTLMATVQLADLKALAGQLHAAAELYRQAIQEASETGQPLSVVSMAHANLGRLLYEWNDLEAAARHLTTCVELGRQWGSADMLVTGAAHLALVRQAQGDAAGAAGWEQQAESAMREPMYAPATVSTAKAYLARRHISSGDLDAGERWRWEAQDSLCNGPSQWCQIGTTTLARLHLAQGAPERVLPLLEPLLRDDHAAEKVSSRVEIFALQALAWRALGDREQAAATLRQALRLAEPGGFVRTFVDEWEPMRLLMDDCKLMADSSLRAYMTNLSNAFRIRPAINIQKSAITNLVEPLSEREQEVLRLIDAGLSNQEIARSLVVAVSTVKTHINNLYGKLGVSSRTQALARGREEQLL